MITNVSAEITLPRTVFGLIAGRPFSADVEMYVDHPLAQRFQGFLARDRYGRQRSEIIFAPGVSSITVTEPVGQRQYALLKNSGGAQAVETDLPRDQQIWSGD